MAPAHQLVVFTMDEQRYALQLAAVERVVRMVEVTPLPQAPQIVLGVINAQGRIIPVVDIRRRFRLPARDIRLSDHLLIAVRQDARWRLRWMRSPASWKARRKP